jgi:hypothetical protein
VIVVMTVLIAVLIAVPLTGEAPRP